MPNPTPKTPNVMQPVYVQPAAANAHAAMQNGVEQIAQSAVQPSVQPMPQPGVVQPAYAQPVAQPEAHHAAGELHHNHQPKPKPKRHLFRRFMRGYLMIVGALVNIFVLVQAILLLLEFLGEHINIV